MSLLPILDAGPDAALVQDAAALGNLGRGNGGAGHYGLSGGGRGGGDGGGRGGANYDKSNRFKYGTTVAGQTFNVVKLGN